MRQTAPWCVFDSDGHAIWQTIAATKQDAIDLHTRLTNLNWKHWRPKGWTVTRARILRETGRTILSVPT